MFKKCLLISLLIFPVSAMAEAVREIRIEGNQRIENSTIETYIGIERGDDVSQYDVDLALKRLYDTGLFSDIQMEQQGNVLLTKVTENPSVNRVAFEGNDQISKEDLAKEVTLRARSIYTRTRVQQDLKRLLDVYRRAGRYSAVITPKIIALEQNRVDLVYEIEEGPSASIEKITFIGNEYFSSSALQQVINSEIGRWYKFLSDADKYDPDRLQYDQELLRKFYFENGFADFKVKSAIAELSPQRDAFYLTYTIEEGPIYTLGDVDVKTTLNKKRVGNLNSKLTTKKGDTYNATEVENSVDAMVEALGDKGFAFVDIDPVTTRRPGKDRIIDLTYTVSEGPRVYVDRINIFGNSRTLDEVIRREFRLNEGDPYSTSKIKRTEQRLNNLGYFETVSIQNVAGSAPDKTDIDVEVQEKSTGEITFGAGFSTTDGALADVGITERNFLGRGQTVRARTLFAARRQQYDFGFTEPYFLGRELEAGFDLYQTTQELQDEASFDRDAKGIILRTGYNLSEKWKHQVRYGYEQSEISNISPFASQFIQRQSGKSTTSYVGHSFIYDGRDNVQNPTRGSYLKLNQDIAGLGGDDRFARHEIQSEYYYPIAKQWTYAGATMVGNITGIGRDVPINQRFFIGSQQFRGFTNAGIGPRDSATTDALGGNTYYVVSNEVRFPLGLPDDLGVSGALFVDAGSLYGLDDSGAGINDDKTLRASAGFGVAWNSPFGPVRVDFAQAFLKEDYDDEEIVRFGFGTRF
ncbi:MAG: outer membrane protein assembly factor BamA [Alphaproteobacteria bacterium]|nr:outer membrane protein assembly factor BamA [Alphaproteobacteria bacterium]